MAVTTDAHSRPAPDGTEVVSQKVEQEKADVFGEEEDHAIRYKTLDWQVSVRLCHRDSELKYLTATRP